MLKDLGIWGYSPDRLWAIRQHGAMLEARWVLAGDGRRYYPFKQAQDIEGLRKLGMKPVGEIAGA